MTKRSHGRDENGWDREQYVIIRFDSEKRVWERFTDSTYKFSECCNQWNKLTRHGTWCVGFDPKQDIYRIVYADDPLPDARMNKDNGKNKGWHTE